MSDNTAEKQQEELDLEVEIIDDVPEEDKNKVRNEDAPLSCFLLSTNLAALPAFCPGLAFCFAI